ncbi:MAG: inositol monophosphatase [Acidimicrobiia bacterium]
MSSATSEQPSNLLAELALGLELADIADKIAMRHFRTRGLRIDRKADSSEVTQADTETEAALRAVLTERRPAHAMLGEEDGLQGPADAEWRWVIDPIDGTANYARGIPVWATLIALMKGSEVKVGVVSAPALGRRWWAARGHGAHTNDGTIAVSSVDDLSAAYLLNPGQTYWGERGDLITALTRSVWRDRGFGDFWQHMLVAEGAVDAACEPIVNLWDLAAVQVIVEEAGGRFTDLDGHARPDGGSAVSTNGLLHDRVLAALTLPA